MEIIDITNDDLKKYKDVFSKADILGMTVEEAVKIVDGDKEKILFVCGPIWMIFEYVNNNDLKYQTFMVNDSNEVVSFTQDDYQVNIGNNNVYFIYEDGRHEALYFLKNSEIPGFDVSSNGLVMHMQYDSKNDVRCVAKYEHFAYGSYERIYDGRLNSPFEVSIERNVKKRDKGFKFMGSKDSYYRLDFDVRNNKWQYDLATIQEFGLSAVMASDTISLHNGVKEFSKYYKVLFSVGDYISITGFPFLSQYDPKAIDEYVLSLGFSNKVSNTLLDIFNDRENYTRKLQSIVLLYKSRMHSFYAPIKEI